MLFVNSLFDQNLNLVWGTYISLHYEHNVGKRGVSRIKRKLNFETSRSLIYALFYSHSLSLSLSFSLFLSLSHSLSLFLTLSLSFSPRFKPPPYFWMNFQSLSLSLWLCFLLIMFLSYFLFSLCFFKFCCLPSGYPTLSLSLHFFLSVYIVYNRPVFK